mmetsp:Transcript_128/g.542  ORF Transcript_128/g.542 Transcript_128/m.542 type:complete len:287 (-) Transcript_128:15-875(-)
MPRQTARKGRGVVWPRAGEEEGHHAGRLFHSPGLPRRLLERQVSVAPSRRPLFVCRIQQPALALREHTEAHGRVQRGRTAARHHQLPRAIARQPLQDRVSTRFGLVGAGAHAARRRRGAGDQSRKAPRACQLGQAAVVAMQLGQRGRVLAEIVAQARVGPVRAQQRDSLGVAMHGGAHQRRSAAAARLVDQRTRRQQPAARIHVARDGGAAQRRVGDVVPGVRVCAGRQQHVQRRQVALLCCDDERSPPVRRRLVDVGAVPKELSDGLDVATLRRKQQSAGRWRRE